MKEDTRAQVDPAVFCQDFSLQAFTQDSLASSLQLRGQVARSAANLLCISYALQGNLAALLLPEQTAQPMRKDLLWQHTCFEFFLAPVGTPRYWEINLSPSGDWNVYAFADYRAGMQEEPALAVLPFTIEQRPASLLLELTFPLESIISPGQPLDLGISAVLQDRNGQRSFWALTHHNRMQPDFHWRDSFSLSVPASR
ncbi:DOMON-like domain-containing protein [Candidatus Electronema sp. PJ]|uniref:DOMON-like domain-containing protein n=1 Tax=Candidatus Electronema sp. PJ TaxID=3401572 RepID=UPI003AA97C8F